MKTYSKVSRSTRLNEHSHKMVKDDIKRDNDSYSYPDHTEANAEALTRTLEMTMRKTSVWRQSK